MAYILHFSTGWTRRSRGELLWRWSRCRFWCVDALDLDRALRHQRGDSTDGGQGGRQRSTHHTEGERELGDGASVLLDRDLADVALVEEVLERVDDLAAFG